MTEEPDGAESELRRIESRLEGIERLLAVRVEQENRRLKTEGLDPVEVRSGHDESH